MKSFYTVLLALFVAISANAQLTLNQHAVSTKIDRSALDTKLLSNTAKGGEIQSVTTNQLQVPTKSRLTQSKALDKVAGQLKPNRAKAPEAQTVYDQYVWSGISQLTSSPYGTVSISQYNEETGSAKITLYGFEVPCTFDMASGTLTIQNMTYLGTNSNGNVYFYLKEVSGNSILSGASSAKSTVGTFDSNGKITFPPLDVWAIGFPENEIGYYVMSYNNVLKPVTWTSLGNATFVDPWVIPLYNVDPVKYAWEVELQQCDIDENVYRLVDPYLTPNCPIPNESTAAHGYIQFNVSDPEHVYFEIVNAGWADSELEITDLFCYNLLTFYMEYYGLDASSVVSALGDDIPYTTFKDGVLTLGSIANENGVKYDALFGDQVDPLGGYSWNNLPMVGSITFPKIEPVDPNEGWTSLGNATLVDPWVASCYGFGKDAPESSWEVEIQQNDADKNVYRLVDPYKAEGCPFSEVNQSKKVGYIQFNASDPDHVYFDLVDAGFANASVGSQMYCYNYLTYLMAGTGYDADDIVSILGDQIPYTTFKDGVLTLGSIAEEDGSITYDACFGIQGQVDGGYRWNDEDGNPVPMLGYILLPGAKLPEEGPKPAEMAEVTGVSVNGTAVDFDDEEWGCYVYMNYELTSNAPLNVKVDVADGCQLWYLFNDTEMGNMDGVPSEVLPESDGMTAYYAANGEFTVPVGTVQVIMFTKRDGLYCLQPIVLMTMTSSKEAPAVTVNGGKETIEDGTTDVDLEFDVDNTKGEYIWYSTSPLVSETALYMKYDELPGYERLEGTKLTVSNGTVVSYYLGDANGNAKSAVAEQVVDIPTGIDAITVDTEKVVYDMLGRRVIRTEGLKGLYIINGKKVAF